MHGVLLWTFNVSTNHEENINLPWIANAPRVRTSCAVRKTVGQIFLINRARRRQADGQKRRTLGQR